MPLINMNTMNTRSNKSGLLFINSARRDFGTPSNFTISWNEDIEMKGIGLLSLVMPNTLYNINSSNNKLSVTEGVLDSIITVPIGTYNIVGLLNTLSSLLNGDSILTGAYNLTLDPVSQRVVITCDTNFTIDPTSLGKALGFQLPDRPQAGTQTGDSLYDISGIREVYIQLDLPLGNRFNSEYRDIIGVVPLVSAEFGGILSRSYESDQQMIWFNTPQYVNSLRVQLIDKDGILVDLNGVDWSMELTYSNWDE